MQVVLSIAPNNELKIGVQSIHCTPKKRTDSTGVLAREQTDRIMSVSHLEVIEGYKIRVVTGLSTLERFKTITASDAEFWSKRQNASLDFISEFQHVCKRYTRKRRSAVGYGELGKGTSFSRFARAKMLSAGAVLERKYTSPGSSVLVTLTIPGNHRSARDVVPRYSGFIMNRLMQIIRRAQSGREASEKTDWLYCWEYQKRGFLHLHLCIADIYPGIAEMLGHDIKEKWVELLHELSEMTGKCLFTNASGKSCWLPRFWQNDVSVVRKSVACYLSKYVSKGANNHGSNDVESRAKLYPVARWWGMARVLSKVVESASSTVSITALSEDIAASALSQMADAMALLGIKKQYSYSFDIKGSSAHIGSGVRNIYYLDPLKFDTIAMTVGNLLSSLIGSCSKEQVKGKNWLLKSFGFDNVEIPDYYRSGVTTINNPDYERHTEVQGAWG